MIALTILATPPVPVISSGLVVSGSVGTSGVLYRITASNSPSSFTVSGLPPGLSVDPVSGAISGTPGVVGVYAAPVSASNAGGTSTATVTFAINPPAVPVIYAATAASGIVGGAFSYYASATGSPTTRAVGGLPAGLFFDAGSGQIFGVPTASGTFAVTLTAGNSAGPGSATLTLVIAAAPPVSAISSGDAMTSGIVGQSLDYYFSTSTSFGSANFPVIRSATGLPPGLSLDASTTITNHIRGTPTVPGIYPVTISATNSGGTSTAIAVFDIAAAPVPAAAPLITSALGTVGTVGRAFSFQIASGNLPTGFGTTGLPPGLSQNTGTGLITGTPTAAGDYTVTVSAVNALGSGTAPLRIRIAATPADLPVITSAAAIAIGDGSNFPYYSASIGASYTTTASNGPASFFASGLPPGLSLNAATGLISGIPLVGGTFLVPISATNAVGTGSAVLTIIASAPPLAINASAQALGYVGTRLSYAIQSNQSLSNNSNSPAFEMTYAAHGLPPGLSVNTSSGIISGTPTAVGSYPVAISATNLAGTDSAVVTFVVGEASVPTSAPRLISTSAGAAGALGIPFAYSFWADALPTSLSADLPPGLILSVESGLLNGVTTLYGKISGNPLASGTFAVPVSATNAFGTTSATATFTIASAANVPIISSQAASIAQLGQPFYYWIYDEYDAVSFTAPVSYEAANLPPGLSLDSVSGGISGTPMMTGVFPVTLGVTVGGVTGTAVWTVSVQPSFAPTAEPGITAAVGALAFVGVPLSFPLSAGSTPDSLSVGALPDGLTFALSSASGPGATTKVGTISGIPTTPGTFTIPVSAGNVAGGSGAVVTLTVRTPQAALPFIVLQPASRSVAAGSEAIFTVAASGVAAPTFQWLRDGQPVPGATGATLLLPAASGTDFSSYSVIASNASGSATSQSAMLGVITDFTAWQSANFSAAEIEIGSAAENWDFNGDGTLNLLDYALGRDPRTGFGGSLPSVTRPAATGLLQITFPRDTRASDITYLVEASGDLGAWTPIASSIHGAATVNLGGAGTISETGGIVRSVSVQDGAAGGVAPRFLRLRIARP